MLAVAGSGLDGDTSRVAAQATTDGTGEFRLEGLTAREWGVSAKVSEQRSAVVRIEVPPDGEVTGVSLVLNEGTELRGRVLVAGAPVAAVKGLASSTALPPDVPGSLRTFRTEADGTFAIDFGPGAEGLVNVRITDPRLPATAFLVAAPGESDLHVEPMGGRVMLSGLGSSWEGIPYYRLALVDANGAYLPLDEVPGIFISEAAENGLPETIIPNLSPGPWSLIPVKTASEVMALSHGQGASLPAVAVFEVEKGAGVKIEVPSSN